MATGKIKTLFSDKENTEALFPRTKIKAVSADSGVGLDALLDVMNYNISNKAPAGFGLGTEIESHPDGALFPPENNCDAVVGTGWCYINENTKNAPIPYGGSLHTVRLADSYIGQWASYIGHAEFLEYRRHKQGKDWSEWQRYDPAVFAPATHQFTIPANGVKTIVFNTYATNAIISCRCGLMERYAVFNYSGYGVGGIRSNVDRICGTEYITYGIRPESNDGTHGFTIWNHSDQEIYVSVFLLLGDEVTVIDGDSGATEVPFEWVNPPMLPGIEYRTTERWNGKAVYTKLFHCGEVPASGRVSTGHLLNCRIIRYHGALTNNNSLPYRDPTTNGTVDLAVSGNYITISSALTSGTSPGSADVQLWYVKKEV